MNSPKISICFAGCSKVDPIRSAEEAEKPENPYASSRLCYSARPSLRGFPWLAGEAGAQDTRFGGHLWPEGGRHLHAVPQYRPETL